jgi:vacuolar-type H+-ATPase subunit I/STV1
MNWLGKVFVVLILIMSLVFMGLAMAVYATHRNWREVVEGPNGLRSQLDQARQSNEELKSEHNRRVEDLIREKDAAEQQLAKLETERVALAENNVRIQSELDKLTQERGEHIAAVASTQSLNEGLSKEATGLRQQIRGEQQARDAAFAKTLDATEAVHQLTGQYETQRERYEQLTKQAAGMRHVMREEGLDPDTEPGAVVPTVDGVVSQVRRTAGAQLVEVTIGADDGLKAGNTLEVFRGSKYLGRVEVLQTSPDKSVGRVDRRFQQGQIVEGDRVATRLKL